MNHELALCRDFLAEDPALYLDMTEAVSSGRGRVLSVRPDGALVTMDSDGGFIGLAAADETAANALLDTLSGEVSCAIAHGEVCRAALEQRLGLHAIETCWQVGYLEPDPPALPASPFSIRTLDASCLDFVAGVYHHIDDPDYLRSLLERGSLIGAFDGDEPVGFIGVHGDGSMGLLEVLPAYRRRGIGTLLENCLIRRELSLGHVPYAQILEDNAVSLALQESLGLTRAHSRLYWTVREEES